MKSMFDKIYRYKKKNQNITFSPSSMGRKYLEGMNAKDTWNDGTQEIK